MWEKSMFLEEKVRKDSEPTFARIICAKLKCGGNAQIFAVALQQQEVLNPLIKRKKTDKDFVLVGLLWPARKDSNLRPSESESDALSSCATGSYCLIIILHGQKKVKCFLSHKKFAMILFVFHYHPDNHPKIIDICLSGSK